MSATLPRIGITMYGCNEEGSYSIPREYIDSIERAHGIPLILPPVHNVQAVLEQIDAVVLIGGGDLCPACYGGSDHEQIYMTDPQRDAYEIELTQAVLESDKPVLGICRGLQVLNTVLGGTLHEHLPDVYGESIKHRLPPRKPVNHEITVVADSMLAKIMGELTFSAPSWHHQCLDQVADELTVVAKAPDGVIEAVQWTAKKWCLAIQWHPELAAAEDPLQQKIFDALVASCLV